MIGGLKYNERKIRLSHGDCVFLYTDGVIEAFNEESLQFSEVNLMDTLRAGSGLPTNELVHSVLSAVKAFEKNTIQTDDITCVCLRYLWM